VLQPFILAEQLKPDCGRMNIASNHTYIEILELYDYDTNRCSALETKFGAKMRTASFRFRPTTSMYPHEACKLSFVNSACTIRMNDRVFKWTS
jgi:hypothetical protein